MFLRVRARPAARHNERMLRTSREVRALTRADRDAALELCARNPAANVYVAARILETDLDRSRGSLLAYCPDRVPEALCWMSSNMVPVECDDAAAAVFAGRVRRQQSQFSSIFGPADQVEHIWSRLHTHWSEPLDIRARQPLLTIAPGQPVLVAPDPRVRRATVDEVDLVAPAAAAMFTEEIGYAPYTDASGKRGYRATTRAIISRGHAFVIVEQGRIVFKAEVGSVGVGACQIQGVWVDPLLRGQGLAAPAMAAVVEQARADIAPLVTLYVNDYNLPALAAYRRVGFSDTGTFATILL